MTAETVRTAPVCTAPPGHETGTGRARTAGCRCPDTTAMHEARLAVQRRKDRLVRLGLAEYDRLVDPGPSRERVEQWLADGVLPARILEGVPLALDTLSRLRRGEGKIRQSSADNIAAWTPTPADKVPSDHVPALGTMRRLRALAALGFTATALADHIAAATPAGTTPTDSTTLTRIRAGTRKGTTPRVRAEVQAVYDLLWDQLPDRSTPTLNRSAGYAHALAARNKWLPPMYLDDDRMEDPSYHPRRPYSTRHGDLPDA